ncbi:hypothetical protein SAICODRAFT_29096 [Saitoella complicata NRRL Y-17804]|uniref:uncharacterized protein n=1 Tax=Saitoella complicata (strain BCRC 22490 / CBS 7301 / JCM 7358 / NBRC 10748 / NRRL Y-17804) TaxID=698492 RepID=UPI000867D523|nr:uncharacterized protein SAICODRAFT_29096 [Saitoella complicata NRRL Y-17804]ODQ55542.1 hypothetical protein SAICODRAFT_29096 [Saitoella complicata NRRL Y-17804]
MPFSPPVSPTETKGPSNQAIKRDSGVSLLGTPPLTPATSSFATNTPSEVDDSYFPSLEIPLIHDGPMCPSLDGDYFERCKAWSCSTSGEDKPVWWKSTTTTNASLHANDVELDMHYPQLYRKQNQIWTMATEWEECDGLESDRTRTNTPMLHPVFSRGRRNSESDALRRCSEVLMTF